MEPQRWGHQQHGGFPQNFVSQNSSFSNSRAKNFSRSNSWDGRFRLEWKPDTMTNIMFRPSFTIKNSDALARSLSATV